MKMKSIYKKAVSNIKADAMLIENTKQKMKESEQSPDHFVRRKNRRPFQIGGLVVVAIFAILIIPPIFQKNTETQIVKNIGGLQIEAVDQKDGTISVDTEFVIKTQDTGLTEKDLMTLLKVTPEVPFALDKKSKGEYILTLQEPLKTDEIVNVALTDEVGTVQRKWAFQTENILKVTQTIPNHEESYVPIQTGIEITLSTPAVSLESFKKSVAISPEVAGEWKKNLNVFTFIPKEALTQKTVYEVTLKKGLETEDGQAFAEPYAFAFETSMSSDDSFYIVFENASKVAETFLLNDPKVISVTATESFKTAKTQFQIDIFQYQNIDAYKEDLMKYSQQLNSATGRFSIPAVDKEKLTKISELKSTLQFEQQEEYMPAYFVLPTDMGAGAYYIEVTGEDPGTGQAVTLRKWIQVSDVSVYQMKVENEALFWLHDAKTGKALSNVGIELQGDIFEASGKTNSEGTLSLQVTDEQKALRQYGVVDIKASDKRFVDLFQVGDENHHNASANYYSYLYTDRSVYLSTDTIEVWGVLKPRNEKEKIPNELLLVLGQNGNAAGQTKVKLNKNGIFSGRISYENLGANSYETLCLQDKTGKVYSEIGINILDYVKPVYQLDVSHKQPITLYPTENPIEAEVQMSFYDGTAAANTDMQIQYYDRNHKTVHVPFQTDKNGLAHSSFRVITDQDTWRPQRINYDIQTTGVENVPLLKTVPAYVIYRDISIEGTYDDKRNMIQVESHHIDISKVKNLEDVTDENVLGDAYNGRATAEIHKTYVEKVANGTYYDFIQKKNVIKYDYVTRDEIVQTKSVQLWNGKGSLENLPEGESDASYYVALKLTDTKGNLVEEKLWYAASFMNYNSGLKAYYFNKENAKNDEERYSFLDQEDVTFIVQENSETVTKGQVIAAVVQDGISEVLTKTTPKVTVGFNEDRLPNYILVGAYFDGKHVYPIAEQYMSFNAKDRELKVEVQPSQEQFAPGEKATVEIKVMDVKTGKAVPNAEVSLSVVDEAVFGVAEQDVDPVADIYSWAFYPNIQAEASYVEHNLLDEGGAEKGSGGDGVGVRKDFVDTAAFLTGQTNSNGIAEFSVSLPDNLTSWRLTAQAVATDLYAGYVKENIQVTQDFFVRSIELNTFMSTDEIHMPLRAQGKEITGTEKVQYQVTLEGDGIQSRTIEVEGAANTWTSAKIGQLPEGIYTVTVYGKTGSYEDKVETKFTVVDNVMSIHQLQAVDLLRKDIQPTKYPLTLDISRASDQMYQAVLQYLSNQTGNRSDERMARAYAEMKFTGESEGSQLEAFADVVSSFGEVSLLPYSDIDWALTAKAQQADLPWLPKGYRNGTYTYKLTNKESTSSEVAFALYGLAVNKQPVLNYILEILENPEGFSYLDQLYLLAGLTALGDETNAQAYYKHLVSEKVATKDAVAFVKSGKTEADYLEATAIASLSASVLHTKEADLFIQYLMDTPSKTELYVMEMMVYLQNYRAELLEPVVFNLETSKGKERITLAALETKRLVLYQADWEALQVSMEKGELLATARLVTDQDGLDQSNEAFSLNRRIEVVGGGDLTVGKKVKITLTPSITDQTYSQIFTITDHLPAGFRYIGMGNSSKSQESWLEGRREGQHVLFYYHNNWVDATREGKNSLRKAENPQALVYYALCVAPGSYTQAPALFTEGGGKQWGQSKKEEVIIR